MTEDELRAIEQRAARAAADLRRGAAHGRWVTDDTMTLAETDALMLVAEVKRLRAALRRHWPSPEPPVVPEASIPHGDVSAAIASARDPEPPQ